MTDTPAPSPAAEFANPLSAIRLVLDFGVSHYYAGQLALIIAQQVAALEAENARLKDILNTPHTQNFLEAVQIEAAHQRERWGSEHDIGKTPDDWLWLIAFLATKAAQAERYGDREKYLHHIITCAAACANWHANASGSDASMRPGIGPGNAIFDALSPPAAPATDPKP